MIYIYNYSILLYAFLFLVGPYKVVRRSCNMISVFLCYGENTREQWDRSRAVHVNRPTNCHKREPKDK